MFRRMSRRSAGYALLIAAALCLVALSPSFGRAEPTGNYRPKLVPAALDAGCFPLPEGVRFDFPYQVRSDGDVETVHGQRRILVVQFDEVDVGTARQQLIDAFGEAGFTPVGTGAELVLRKPGVGWVAADVQPIPGVAADAVVRGTITLDLPSIEAQSDAAVCSDPYVTKRFHSSTGGDS